MRTMRNSPRLARAYRIVLVGGCNARRQTAVEGMKDRGRARDREGQGDSVKGRSTAMVQRLRRGGVRSTVCRRLNERLQERPAWPRLCKSSPWLESFAVSWQVYCAAHSKSSTMRA